MDSTTGVLKVRDNLVSGKEYKLTVRATDKGKSLFKLNIVINNLF